MKKFNFKALLVLVLSFVLIFALTACEPDEEDPIITANDIFLEAMGGLDLTIDAISKLTDTFDIDLELYAIVNDAEYTISIKGNLDISDEGNNDNNLIAIEVTKVGDEGVIFGFYYNGAEKALFVNIPGQDVARYIDGIDLYDLATMADKEEGQNYYTSFIDFSITSAADILELVSGMLFDQENFSIKESNGKTTYTFNLNEDLEIDGLLGFAGGMIDVDSIIDTIFGTEGFKLSQMTVPPLSASFVIVNGPNGLEEFKILVETEAFKFKINKNDEGKNVDALDLELGIRIKTLAPKKGDDYAISLEVPSLVDNDYYEYFSPLNIETSGELTIDNDIYIFVIKTDINPFKIKESEIFVSILENENTFVLLRTLDGVVYAEGLAIVGEDEEPVLLCISIEEAIDLFEDLIKGLDKIELPDLDELDPDDKDKEEESIDPMAVISALMEVVGKDGLYANRKMVDNILNSLMIEPEEIKDEIEFEVEFERDEDEKIIGIKGQLWMANIIDSTAQDKEFQDEEEYNINITIEYNGEDISKISILVTIGEDDDLEEVYNGSLEILCVDDDDKSFDGFIYEHTLLNEEGTEEEILVKLTNFTCSWGDASTIDPSDYEIDTNAYADILDGVTVDSIIKDINDLIAKLFDNVEIE